MKNKRKFEKWQRREIRMELAKSAKKMNDIKAYKRLLALKMYIQGMPNKQISETLGFSQKYITELVTKYLNMGMTAIVIDKRTSNNRRMSFTQETDFLNQFTEMADAGQLVTVKVILQKFEETTGKSSSTSTIYDLLKRHGWRKVQPRPQHPGKASPEEIASSKKLTQNSEKWYWKYVEETVATSTNTTKA